MQCEFDKEILNWTVFSCNMLKGIRMQIKIHKDKTELTWIFYCGNITDAHIVFYGFCKNGSFASIPHVILLPKTNATRIMLHANYPKSSHSISD